MGGVFVGFAIIAVVILVGYGASRLGIGGPHAEFVLTRVAFFITNPALLFTVLARADVREVFSSYLVVAAIAAAGAGALYVLISRLLFPAAVSDTTIGALASGYVNASNIGLPVAVYVLGDASLIAPVLLLQLIVLSPIALTVLDISSRGHASLKAILTQPVRNPMIIASLAGVVVAVTGWHIPTVVLQPIELLGGAAVPLILMAFGMSLRGARPLRNPDGRREVIVALILKSVAMPSIAFVVAGPVLGLSGHALFAAVSLAALPTAQNVFNFASRYGRSVAVARDAGLLTMIAAVPVLLGVTALLA